MDHGKVKAAQPDIGRVGGLTEAKRVSELAGQRSVSIVPHAWKTDISIAASVHLAAVTPHCPFIEFLPGELCESSLRKELTLRGPEMKNGTIRPPNEPGLGIELNRNTLERFEKAAAAIA